MNRLFKIIITLFLCLGSVSSCGVYRSTYQPENSTVIENGVEIRSCNFEVIQTYDKHSGLAWDSDYNPVKIIVQNDIVYDQKKFNNRWVLIDTYSYFNKQGNQMTVPVFVPYDEFMKQKYPEKYVLKSEATNTIPVEIRNCTFEVVQTLDPSIGLAWDSDLHPVLIVRKDQMIYDRKKITDKWALTGLYTYTNKQGDLKTVPVFISFKDYTAAIEGGHHYEIYDK